MGLNIASIRIITLPYLFITLAPNNLKPLLLNIYYLPTTIIPKIRVGRLNEKLII